MSKPRIAVFSGPNATIANSPTLVTSNKGRLSGDTLLPGRFDPLVAQALYEPVRVKIRKLSAHPMEEDARASYLDDGQEYHEVELRPEDGLYLLPYVARRADGTPTGVPFEDVDLFNPHIDFGGRQFFYPDASRIFEEIDRTILGRTEAGSGNLLSQIADFDFIRTLPPAGYPSRGERPGEDYFFYKPFPTIRLPRYRDLAKLADSVQTALDRGIYAGAIWLDGSPTLEESIYWLSLLVDTELPIVGVAAQRPHGQLGNDGAHNIFDAVRYIVSGRGQDIGAVAVQEELIFAARDFKKADDRPGNYKVTGGAGGVLGNIGPPVSIWYRPNYRHTSRSALTLRAMPFDVEFLDGAGDRASIRISIKDAQGNLRRQSIPKVHMVKYGAYMDEDSTQNPEHEVDILARIEKGLLEQRRAEEGDSPFHGFVLEGMSPYGVGSGSQMAALEIAAFSGMPVVRVGRADPGGPVPLYGNALTIAGSNLDANKARMLLMAAMLKLGRLPKARNPRCPTPEERAAVLEKIKQFNAVFDSH